MYPDTYRSRYNNKITQYEYLPQNYNRTINNPQYVKEYLLPNISKKLKRQLTGAEVKYTITFIKKLDPAIFKDSTLEDITFSLVDVVSGHLMKQKCDIDDLKIDVHELLKGQMGITSENNETYEPWEKKTTVPRSMPIDIGKFLEKDSQYGIQQLFHPESLYRYNYIFLDSRYRLLDGDGTEVISWDHVNSVSRSQGSFNTVGVIRDIVELKVMPIKLPYVANADTDLERITMLIEEFNSQSYIGHENRRFHFIFDTTVNGDYIVLDPHKFNDGVFRFGNAITQLDKISITFGSPLQKIYLDTDRLSSTTTYANIAVITTVLPHNLVSGNVVIISTFDTVNPAGDFLPISLMNSQAGSVSTVLSPTTFSIPIDLSSIRNTIPGTISVTNASNAIVGIGTTFTTSLIVGDSILIEDSLGVRRYYTIGVIIDNLNLTLGAAYTGATESGLNIMLAFGGTLTMTNASVNVVGVGTAFSIDFKVDDVVVIRDSVGVLRKYTIASITSNTAMTLTEVYAGITEPLLVYFKDNSIDGFSFITYFNSKRIVIPIEITYIHPE